MSSVEKMPKNETINLREKHIGNSCQLFFRNDPLKIVRAEGQYMYDENGQRFLDCINNVAHVGHCNPKVVAAGSRQMSLQSTNNRFLHDELVVCAERISSLLPDPLSVCFFVNSGSEANDLALRLARIHTGNKEVITVEHAYHGHLTSMIDISPYKFNLPGAPPKPDWVHVAPMPDTYRGEFRSSELPDEDLGILYAEVVDNICKEICKTKPGVCAFFAESLLSCGGQVLLPPNYLKSVYKSVRTAGGICIADEVQVGFGRTGKWWAFQLQGADVIPDIVTMGKPMGNGHPIAAVVTTPAIARSFQDTGVEYFNTYGGNAVSCAIANAVLDTIEEDNLIDHAVHVGAIVLSGFRDLQSRHKIIGDVRGAGLFVGMELVENRVTRVPATEKAKWVVNRMRFDHNILLSADGPDSNVIKVKPPMVFSEENAKELLKALEAVLSKVEQMTSIEFNKLISTKESCHAKNETISGKKDTLIKSV